MDSDQQRSKPSEQSRPFLLDVPFFRAALPCLVLYAYYWGFVLNPPLMEEEETETGARSPHVARYLRDKARSLVLAGRHSEAIPPLLELHKAYPESHLYHFELANAYHALKHYEEEARMWELFLQHAPIPLEGCPQIAVAYRNLQKTSVGNREVLKDQTLKSLERCYEFDSTHSDSIFFLAHEYELRGNLSKALPLYKKGAELAPHYPDLPIGLARVHIKLGHTSEARRLIDSVLKKRPENSDALLVAGLVAIREGDTTSARAYLRKGAKVSPGYEDIRSLLAELNHSHRSAPGGRKDSPL